MLGKRGVTYPVLSYISLKPGCRTYLTTHVKSKQVSMYVQGISNNKAQVKKGKMGLSHLGNFDPQ